MIDAIRTLRYPDVDALRAALDGCLDEEHVFVGALADVAVGERAVVEFLVDGDKIPRARFTGIVSWRYPRGLAPPGRDEGGALKLDEPVDVPFAAGLTPLLPPGARLPRYVRAMMQASSTADAFEHVDTVIHTIDELPAADPPSAFEAEDTRTDLRVSGPDVFPPHEEDDASEFEAEYTQPSMDVAEISSRTQSGEAPLSAAGLAVPMIRSLPTSPLWPVLPAPVVSGRAWTDVSSKKEQQHLTPVHWPKTGTQRQGWIERELANGRPIGDLLDDEDSFDERTDPGRIVQAVEDAAESLGAPTQYALPVALWLGRLNDASPTPMFEAGVLLPAEATLKLKAPKGAVHVEAQVLADRFHEAGQDLVGVARFPLDEGTSRTPRARFSLEPSGRLTISVPADEPMRTEIMETGIVPVPQHGGERDRGLLTTIKRLFKSD